MPEKT